MLSQIFKKPKDRPQDHQRTGIFYKVNCHNSPFSIHTYKCRWKVVLTVLTCSQTPSWPQRRISDKTTHAKNWSRHPLKRHHNPQTTNYKLHQETLFSVVALNDGHKRGEGKKSLSAHVYSFLSSFNTARVFQHVKRELRYNKHLPVFFTLID